MNIAKDIITISEDEISTYTADIYRISSSQVIGKTDVLLTVNVHLYFVI